MDLSGIISISGKPGLAKIVTQSRNGIIVESLVDGKKFPVVGTERISSLEDISIYTYEEDVLLLEVFKKMFKHYKGKEALSHKTEASELKTTFGEILPNFDEDKVYTSDIKKVFQWYNLLLKGGFLKEKEEEKKEDKKSPAKKPQSSKKETKKSTKEKKAVEPKAKKKKDEQNN
jgi:hypothetical protein